ncbi:hypothetical protein ADUPG1_012048, partial [Aduncisulcus paluster]
MQRFLSWIVESKWRERQEKAYHSVFWAGFVWIREGCSWEENEHLIRECLSVSSAVDKCPSISKLVNISDAVDDESGLALSLSMLLPSRRVLPLRKSAEAKLHSVMSAYPVCLCVSICPRSEEKALVAEEKAALRLEILVNGKYHALSRKKSKSEELYTQGRLQEAWTDEELGIVCSQLGISPSAAADGHLMNKYLASFNPMLFKHLIPRERHSSSRNGPICDVIQASPLPPLPLSIVSLATFEDTRVHVTMYPLLSHADNPSDSYVGLVSGPNISVSLPFFTSFHSLSRFIWNVLVHNHDRKSLVPMREEFPSSVSTLPSEWDDEDCQGIRMLASHNVILYTNERSMNGMGVTTSLIVQASWNAEKKCHSPFMLLDVASSNSRVTQDDKPPLYLLSNHLDLSYAVSLAPNLSDLSTKTGIRVWVYGCGCIKMKELWIHIDRVLTQDDETRVTVGDVLDKIAEKLLVTADTPSLREPIGMGNNVMYRHRSEEWSGEVWRDSAGVPFSQSDSSLMTPSSPTSSQPLAGSSSTLPPPSSLGSSSSSPSSSANVTTGAETTTSTLHDSSFLLGDYIVFIGNHRGEIKDVIDCANRDALWHKTMKRRKGILCIYHKSNPLYERGLEKSEEEEEAVEEQSGLEEQQDENLPQIPIQNENMPIPYKHYPLVDNFFTNRTVFKRSMFMISFVSPHPSDEAVFETARNIQGIFIAYTSTTTVGDVRERVRRSFSISSETMSIIRTEEKDHPPASKISIPPFCVSGDSEGWGFDDCPLRDEYLEAPLVALRMINGYLMLEKQLMDDDIVNDYDRIAVIIPVKYAMSPSSKHYSSWVTAANRTCSSSNCDIMIQFATACASASAAMTELVFTNSTTDPIVFDTSVSMLCNSAQYPLIVSFESEVEFMKSATLKNFTFAGDGNSDITFYGATTLQDLSISNAKIKIAKSDDPLVLRDVSITSSQVRVS